MSAEEKAELEISYNNEELFKKVTKIKIKNFWGGVAIIVVSIASGAYSLSTKVSDWNNWRQSTNTNISELKEWKNRVEMANEYHYTEKK